MPGRFSGQISIFVFPDFCEVSVLFWSYFMRQFKVVPSACDYQNHSRKSALHTARRCFSSFALAAPVLLSLAACSSVPLEESGGLTSYGNLGAETGKMGKTRIYVDGAAVKAAKTVRIVPTVLSAKAVAKLKQPQDGPLVSNALDRALCVALSDRYQVVMPGEPADLTLHSVITDVVPTNKAAAGVSAVVTAGTSFILPVGIPRLPMGLGGLAVEGEAVDQAGQQKAALLWAKGGNSFTSKPRVSEVGDAYQLAAGYSADFSNLLIKGEAPKMLDMHLPTSQKVKSFFGGKPKYAACDTFGRQSGLMGVASGMVAAPPDWSDKGGQAKSGS